MDKVVRMDLENMLEASEVVLGGGISRANLG